MDEHEIEASALWYIQAQSEAWPPDPIALVDIIDSEVGFSFFQTGAAGSIRAISQLLLLFDASEIGPGLRVTEAALRFPAASNATSPDGIPFIGHYVDWEPPATEDDYDPFAVGDAFSVDAGVMDGDVSIPLTGLESIVPGSTVGMLVGFQVPEADTLEGVNLLRLDYPPVAEARPTLLLTVAEPDPDPDPEPAIATWRTANITEDASVWRGAQDDPASWSTVQHNPNSWRRLRPRPSWRRKNIQ